MLIINASVSLYFALQFSLVMCCIVAVNAMPNPQAPRGSIVPTAEGGHFSYDGKLCFIYFVKIFIAFQCCLCL